MSDPPKNTPPPGSKPELSTETRLLNKPNHGAKSKCHKYVWFDYGTDDWSDFAKDYRDVKGSDIFPETRIEGKGNWFVWLGEAARPKRVYRRRKQA